MGKFNKTGKREMQNKYEETLKLENKLEKTPVEEAIKKQKAIDNN